MKLKLLYSFVIALFCVLGCKKATPRLEEEKEDDIAIVVAPENLNLSYATNSSAQKLDLYMPDVIKEQNPVLIWVHGGGWKSGDKGTFKNTNQFRELRKRGYVVVTINYRLSGEAKFPAQIYDVKTAIRWVKANAAKYKLNSQKIGLWGSSAGGHLVALAGTSGGVTELEDLSQGNAGHDSKVQVVIDWFGPTDFLKMDEMATAQNCGFTNHKAANSGESELIGYPIATRPDLVDKASPVTYITSEDPPFFIEHGLIDCTVAYGQSQLLYDKMLPVVGSQKLKLKFLPNTGHGGGLFSSIETVTEVINFLDTYLK